MNRKELILLTAGGSGGHVYPAQALAEELLKDSYELGLVTDARGKSNYKGTLNNIANYSVLCGPLVGKSMWFKIKSFAKTAIGVLQACYYIIKLKPKCVVGFGGYAAFPLCCAAILTKTDLIIHEQNSVMSRTNRKLAKYAKIVALTFDNTKFAPKNKSVLVGLPVRDEVLAVKKSAYNNDDKLNVLILGGSQGASVFSDVVPLAIRQLLKEQQQKIKVVAQVRKEDLAICKKLYQKTNAEFELASFFENMPELYKNANLIISRTGASSVFEIATVGRASVLVPLPTSADNHQFYNAQMLKDSSYIVAQKDFNSLVVAKYLEEFLDNSKKLKDWAKIAYNSAIIDSAIKFKNVIKKEL